MVTKEGDWTTVETTSAIGGSYLYNTNDTFKLHYHRIMPQIDQAIIDFYNNCDETGSNYASNTLLDCQPTNATINLLVPNNLDEIPYHEAVTTNILTDPNVENSSDVLYECHTRRVTEGEVEVDPLICPLKTELDPYETEAKAPSTLHRLLILDSNANEYSDFGRPNPNVVNPNEPYTGIKWQSWAHQRNIIVGQEQVKFPSLILPIYCRTGCQ